MEYVIRPARPAEHHLFPDIERSTADLVTSAGTPEGAVKPASIEFIDAVARSGAVFVAATEAEDLPAGFILAGFLDRGVYIYLMTVAREHQRRGLGRRLMLEGCAFARREGLRQVTFSTFLDVPWNGPFFETLGFGEVPRAEWTPAFFLLHARQRAIGLPMERRGFMRLELT